MSNIRRGPDSSGIDSGSTNFQRTLDWTQENVPFSPHAHAGKGVAQADTTDEIEPPDDATENDRQAWILSELQKGGEIRVGTVAARFRCSPATAKRELAELRKRNLIRFEGPAKTGGYRLVKGRSYSQLESARRIPNIV